MGLEVVEFVLDVEKAFDIQIPDEDTVTMKTPRDFVHYVVRRLSERRLAEGVRSHWTTEEVEQVIEGLLVKTLERADFDLDTEFKSLFP